MEDLSFLSISDKHFRNRIINFASFSVHSLYRQRQFAPNLYHS